MKSQLRFSCSLLSLALATAIVLSGNLAAQTDVTTGRIAGQVLDQDGQPLPGVAVEAKNKGTGLTLNQTTDVKGTYRIVNLPVGTYDVKAALSGFRTQDRPSVVVTLGAAVTADFKLGLASVAETLTVTAEVPTVETTQTASQTTVDNTAIRSLPSNGRNFTNFVLLTPNAQVDTQRGNLALGGQRGINTNITVDGVDFNNSFFGGASGGAEGRAPFSISQESVREFQVIQNGASVEFGRSAGGFVNVVTKSGTNDFHGSAFYYNRPSSLVSKLSNPEDVANNIPANSIEPRDQKTQQFGASIGGPLVKERLFFFGSWDQQKQNTLVPVDSRILDFDIFQKYPAYRSDPDYAYTQDGRVFFARLDVQANDKNRFLIRGNFNHYEGLNATNTSTTHSSGFNGLEGNDTQTYVASWNGTFTSSLLNDLNVQYSKDDTPRVDLAPTLPEVQYGRTLRYGGISFLPITGTTDRKSVGDTLTFLSGAHAAKIGFDYNDSGMDQVFKGNWRGVFIFNGTNDGALKANFLAGRWTEYRQFFGLNGLTADEAGKFKQRQKELAFFIQDQWYAAPNLTITAGVRYERLNNPDDPVLNLSSQNAAGQYTLDGTIPDVNNQWSPRLSIAWSPERNSKSVVRFSAGRYWSRTPELLFAQLYTSNGVQGTQYSVFAGGTTNAPTQPTDPLSPGWGNAFQPVGVAQIGGSPTRIAAPGVSVVSPDFTNPRTDKASLGFEREFFTVALGVEGVWAKTSNLERLGDENLEAVGVDPVSGVTLYRTDATGKVVRPNKAYGRVISYKSDARSRFGSVSFTARKNFSSGFRFFGSATWSQDKDNDSNERNFSGIFAEDVSNIELNYGYSDRDIKWRFLGNASYERNITKSIGFFASALFNYQTGRPYSAFTNIDVNKDTVLNTDRPTVNGAHFDRNTFRQPDFYSLDARLGLGIELGPGRLQLFAEVFNLTNTGNRFTTNTTYGLGPDPNPSFGVLNGFTQTPRTVQLAARYDF